MSKKNKAIDVFKYIDTHGGDRVVCWEWTASCNTQGRPQFSYNGSKPLVYRIVYELIHGVKLHRKEIVRHKCDNPICCNPTHLEIGSHQDNMDDMTLRERHGMPKTVVKAIRKLYFEGRIDKEGNKTKVTQDEIAQLYGTSRERIKHIVNGTSYQRWLEEDHAD